MIDNESDIYPCKLYTSRITNDAPILLSVSSVWYQLSIPHPVVWLTVCPMWKYCNSRSGEGNDSFKRQNNWSNPMSVIFKRIIPNLEYINISYVTKYFFSYLMFPLFVPYLMWSQMASNISLAVLTWRASNN